MYSSYCFFFLFFNDTPTTEIYTYCHTLSLHDALPISSFDQSPPAETNTQADRPSGRRLPLTGLRVVEFTHMVMGPTCGLVLADLGAEVIKIAPVEGDRTRPLLGAGAGFFPMFNRNAKSIGLNLPTPQRVEIARKLARSADVVDANYRPGPPKT